MRAKTVEAVAMPRIGWSAALWTATMKVALPRPRPAPMTKAATSIQNRPWPRRASGKAMAPTTRMAPPRMMLKR